MRKLSKRQQIQNKKVDQEALIAKMRTAIKQDKAVIEKYKEYGVSLDEINTVPICFCDLDVSAKTKNKRIYLNSNMLKEKDPFEFAMPYGIHESIHLAQQISNVHLDKSKADDYLSMPTELESFQAQVDYKKRHEGEAESERYVKDLTSYHGLSGREKKEKEEELLQKK